MTRKARRTHLLLLIQVYCRAHGYSPTVRELGTAAGLSSMSTLHRDLVALRDEGLIEWDPHRYRTIRAVSR